MEEDQNTVIDDKRNAPFFLRVVSILIIVTGLFGFLFYLLVFVYQVTGRNFLYDVEYKGFSGYAFYFVLVMQVVLNGGLLMSGLQLLKLKKSGLYIFTLSYIIFALISYTIQDSYGWTIPIVGLVLLIVMLLYIKVLK